MYQNNISFLYFILIRLFAQKKRNYAVNNKMKNGSSVPYNGLEHLVAE